MTRARSCWIAVAALTIGLGAASRSAAQATTTGCSAPLHDALTQVKIADRPFDPVSTRDGCWIFVSAQRTAGPNGVEVLRHDAGKVTEQRFVPIPEAPAGIVLTHDETLLIVTTGTHATFLDVARMESGNGNAVLGSLTSNDFVGAIMAVVTADDRWAFISQERTASITVVDLDKIRGGAFDERAIAGRIPSGQATVGLALSPDGKYLYSTSEVAPPRFGYPSSCSPEQQAAPRGRRGGAPPSHSEALLQVIDVAKAITTPALSVIATARAGCNAVRVALSPNGATAYVTARGDNALLVFDTQRLLTDPTHALTAHIGVGESPVGIAVINGGGRIVVTNSNRFGPDANTSQTLTVVDASLVSAGKKSVMGTIKVGAFPRQLSLSADGQTLLLTNFASGTLDVIDVTRLPLRK